MVLISGKNPHLVIIPICRQAEPWEMKSHSPWLANHTAGTGGTVGVICGTCSAVSSSSFRTAQISRKKPGSWCKQRSEADSWKQSHPQNSNVVYSNGSKIRRSFIVLFFLPKAKTTAFFWEKLHNSKDGWFFSEFCVSHCNSWWTKKKSFSAFTLLRL